MDDEPDCWGYDDRQIRPYERGDHIDDPGWVYEDTEHGAVLGILETRAMAEKLLPPLEGVRARVVFEWDFTEALEEANRWQEAAGEPRMAEAEAHAWVLGELRDMSYNFEEANATVELGSDVDILPDAEDAE